MIVLHLKLDRIYGFEDFEIDFTYPKKVVNSIIEGEHLEGRERFRYKKIVVLMGTNATGKTSLGRALLRISDYINTGNPAVLYDMVSENTGKFCIDFVNEGYVLQRLTAYIDASKMEVSVKYAKAEIEKMDSYEKCVEKLEEDSLELFSPSYPLRKKVGFLNCRFAYPEIESSLKTTGVDKNELLKTLKSVIGTLDPTLGNVTLSRDLKDTFIIRRKGREIIIQDGKLLNNEALSSGTAEGIDVAVFLASMMTKKGCFYYCDEHFSYIQSDIEKRIFGIMLDRIQMNEQLIFTTHNTDMLDLNLPKHSYIFLRRQMVDDRCKVTAIAASEILKRNTDSIRNAVENDVFASLPDDSLLDELEAGWADG
ncbi:MAG: DNA repair protein Rad50 [Clostridiales bacterium]|nr:DNA repair protein Rad50 [Clostridiales bacterium]